MSIEQNISGMNAASPYRLGLVLVTLSAVLWSTAGYFTRAVPLDASALLFWRGLFGAITSFIFIAFMERGNTLRAFTGIGRAGLVFCVISSAGMISFLYALRLTSVAHVSIIYAAVPFIAAAMAWIVMRERISVAVLIASCVALAGVVVTVAGGAGEGSVLGDLLALLMTTIVASMMVLRRRFQDVPMVPAACLSALLSALISLPVAQSWPTGFYDVANLAAFGISNMGLALTFFAIGAKFIPAAQTALIGALETPLAPLWVWLAFGETPQRATMIGGVIVLVAVVGNIVIEGRRGKPS